MDSPALDARLLLAHALGTDRAGLLRDRDRPIDPSAFDRLLARRAAREPVALILGTAEFWSLPFAVSGETLVPRPDSETIVEAALGHAGPVRRVLDLGTGTGCLLLAVLSERPAAFGIGVDRNQAAAALARRNAAALGLAGRAAFLCGDWAAALEARFDLVLSNPPYIEADAIAALMPEVAAWEPGTALDGGLDGLDAYRALLAVMPRLLAPGGLAVFELGIGQDVPVAALARRAGFHARTRADLAGIARALLLEKGLGSEGPGD